MNFLEIGHAITSDIRALIRRDCRIDLVGFPVDSPADLLVCAKSGQSVCDQMVQDLASMKSGTTQEANNTLLRAIVLVKFRDQCLDPVHLTRYVESTFTSMQYFSSNMKEAFEADKEQESATLAMLVFYACIYWMRDEVDVRTFVNILTEMRLFLFFSSNNRSILTIEEDDFAFDLVDACFDISSVSVRDMKKQVISVIHRIPSNDDVEIGSELLSSDNDTISLFVSHYLGSEKVFLSFQKAVSSFLALIALFHRMGAPISPRLTDRMRKIQLLRDMIMQGITAQQIPTQESVGRIVIAGSSRTMFSNHLENFSSSIQISPKKIIPNLAPYIPILHNSRYHVPNNTVQPVEQEEIHVNAMPHAHSAEEPGDSSVSLDEQKDTQKAAISPEPSLNEESLNLMAPETLTYIPEFLHTSPKSELEVSIAKFEDLVRQMEKRKVKNLGEIKQLVDDIKTSIAN